MGRFPVVFQFSDQILTLELKPRIEINLTIRPIPKKSEYDPLFFIQFYGIHQILYLIHSLKMKQALSIFLLSCFAFYQFGYFVVLVCIPRIIDQQWEGRIWDQGISLSEGELVKIPFAMPYGQNQEEFTSVNHSIQIDGAWKRVIKQRYFDDHLEVITVPDRLESNLEAQLKTWASSFNPDTDAEDIPPLQKLILKSFHKNFTSPIQYHNQFIFNDLKPINQHGFYAFSILESNPEITSPPPQILQNLFG